MMNQILAGEKVVLKDNLSYGLVLETKDDQVLVQTEDGLKQWVSTSSVLKLLLETDPNPNCNNLNEKWDID
jgi:hypothetical protein